MQVFKDNAGRDWSLSLTIGNAMRVRDRLGVDLLQPEVGEPPLLTQLGTDEMLLAQVIAALLESQFELLKIDATQVYQCFDGPTFGRAHEAFYKELIDFFHQRGRMDRARAVEKQMQMIIAGTKAAMTRVEKINVDAVIDQAMKKVDEELLTINGE